MSSQRGESYSGLASVVTIDAAYLGACHEPAAEVEVEW